MLSKAILEYSILAQDLQHYHRDTALLVSMFSSTTEKYKWLLLRNRWLKVSLYIACNAVLEKAAAFSSYMSCNQLQGVAAPQQVVCIER